MISVEDNGNSFGPLGSTDLGNQQHTEFQCNGPKLLVQHSKHS